MVKKLLFVVVAVGTGFVQGTQTNFFDEAALNAEALRKYPVLENYTRKLISPGYHDYGAGDYTTVASPKWIADKYEDLQAERTRDRNSWLVGKKREITQKAEAMQPASAVSGDDFFNQEELVKEAYQEFPVLTGHDAWHWIYWRNFGPDDVPSSVEFSADTDWSIDLEKERDTWLSQGALNAMNGYVDKARKKASFTPKDRIAGVDSYRTLIESRLQNYLGRINYLTQDTYSQQIVEARSTCVDYFPHKIRTICEYRYVSKPGPSVFFSSLIFSRAKRMQMKHYFDKTIALINRIHGKLVNDSKNLFHKRSASDKQEIEREMKDLDFVFRCFCDTVSNNCCPGEIIVSSV